MTSASRRLRKAAAKGRLVPFALGVIFAGALFDIVLLLIEIRSGWNDRPIHLLTAIGLVTIMCAAAIVLRQTGIRANSAAPRLAELAELRRGIAAAETSNMTKARYLANVSHEIRSPLNAIYGYAQLIEQEANVRPKDAARIIRRCAEHMSGLVESLLDLSRAENGVLRLRSEVVRLPDFLEQIVLMMRPAAQAKGIGFAYEENGRLPEFVRLDQSRFRQALINLLSNAIKFTQQGQVTLRVSYRGQTARFEVIDTGPGILPESQGRIFAPYEQIDGQSGAGLGLTITKAIVEILGGMLELDSAPGKGSCFRIVMMLGEVSGMQVPATAQRRICGHEGPQRSVLVVDDDADQRSFLEQFLRACGFEVAGAPDGETAVAMSAERDFDLAILDISLPGMSGWEVAAHLRHSAEPDIAIVMASANAQEFHRPDAERPAHDLFFIKPYRLDELAEGIGGLLQLNWKWEAVGAATTPDAPGPAALSEQGRAHVARLRELLQIGHVRGIEAEIALLEALPDTDRGLVRALYAALDEFDLTGMAKILEDA